MSIDTHIKVGVDSTLQIGTVQYSGFTFTVGGDVVSDGGHKIRIDGTPDNHIIISGSVQIKNTVDGVVIHHADIGGSSQFSNNSGHYSIVFSNIGGNVQVKDNSSTSTWDLFNNFAGNTINGNLQCSGNSPAPVALNPSTFLSEPNSVSGNKQGQCAGL